MAIALVRQVGQNHNTTTNTTVAVTLSVTPAAGNTLIGYMRGGSNFALSSISDTKGNTWTIDAVTASTNTTAAVYSCQPTTPLVSGDVVTFTLAGSAASKTASIYEFSGVLNPSPVDQTAIANSGTTNTTGSAGPTATLTGSNDLVFTGCATSTSNTSTYNASGYTMINTSLGTAFAGGAYKILSGSTAAQSVTYTWTTTGNWAVALATYKEQPSNTDNFFQLF
jgi:hypothetical protein